MAMRVDFNNLWLSRVRDKGVEISFNSSLSDIRDLPEGGKILRINGSEVQTKIVVAAAAK